MRTTCLFAFTLLMLLAGCQPDMNYEIRGFTEKIIVEGYVASGEYPRVYLSLNVPLWQEVDSALIMEKVIRAAKVTVSDGEKSEILTSGWDKNHFPPYVYRATEIKGQEGKRYSLKVEYGGYTVTSTTTIPYCAGVKRFETAPVTGNDSMKVLKVLVAMDPFEKKSYRIFSKKKQDGVFVETKMLFNETLNMKGEQTFIINPAPQSNLPSYSQGGYFLKGDSVIIKVSAIDSTSTSFFKAFSINSGMGRDIDIAQVQQLNSNITEPGFGIWYGSGAKNYLVVIQ